MINKKINFFGIASTVIPLIVLISFAFIKFDIIPITGDDAWGKEITIAILMFIFLMCGVGSALMSFANKEEKKTWAITGLILNGLPLLYAAINLS